MVEPLKAGVALEIRGWISVNRADQTILERKSRAIPTARFQSPAVGHQIVASRQFAGDT